MKTITLLSDEEVVKILESSTSSSISQKTQIKESTIKNYKTGRTKVKDMPISMREIFTNTYLNNTIQTDSTHPQHFAISDEDWEKIRREARRKDPYQEHFMVDDLFNKRCLSNEEKLLTYFLIDFGIESPINLETIMSISLGQKIGFIVKASSLPYYLLDSTTFVSLETNDNYPKLDINKINFGKYPEMYDYTQLISDLTNGLNYPIAKSIMEYFEEKNVKDFADMRNLVKQNFPDFKIKYANKFQQVIYEQKAKQAIKTFVE